MGLQIGFYAIGEDHWSLLEFAQKIDLVAIPAAIDTGEPVQPVPPMAFAIAGGQQSDPFYLLPGTLRPQDVLYERVTATPSRSKVMTDASPVIQFKPSPYAGDQVYNGRCYFGMSREYIHYDLARTMYDKLARQIRKWARTDRHRFYVGPYTAKQAHAGQIRLMHSQWELKVS